MSEKFTPGPWKVIISSWENSLICAEDGTLIAICKINADVTEDTQDEFESIKNYNADLLADAWQLPDLRREIKELKAINKDVYEALDHLCIAAQKVCDDFCCGAGCSQDARDCKLEGGLIRAEIALRKARGEK